MCKGGAHLGIVIEKHVQDVTHNISVNSRYALCFMDIIF